ncbi:NRDE family protein (plasmid) [Photobacterium sp. GJ3]|uniref:NRDE family protein n=1 Tax=Photobacterium sp. GJ3 TaxID=2829502 RepID=UPI001B8BAE77|nr:NRDE family protein [Photobacterium sp. GJ3]QUJ69514.1 NRDE family protein [Photobacterium sp. GJ3]
MCTASWRITPEGYELLFNRDERRERPLAQPPARFHSAAYQTQALMPIDPLGQGSWIAVNQYGLSLCLLNHYQGETPNSADSSRGQIVRALAFCPDAASVMSQFSQLRLARFAPFTLLILAPSADTTAQDIPAVCWDGKQMLVCPVDAPVTSSSVAFETVRQNRHETFAQLTSEHISPETLMQFHHSHAPDHGFSSVCMHREHSQTVSLTQVLCNKNTVQMHYYDKAPVRNRVYFNRPYNEPFPQCLRHRPRFKGMTYETIIDTASAGVQPLLHLLSFCQRGSYLHQLFQR